MTTEVDTICNVSNGYPCYGSCKSYLIWQSNLREYLLSSKDLKNFSKMAKCENG